MVLRIQRRLKFWYCGKNRKEFQCKHSIDGSESKGKYWARFQELDGSDYYWCENCFKERVSFIPQEGKLCRGIHKCSLCNVHSSEMIVFINYRTEIPQQVHVCHSCFKSRSKIR